MSKLFCGIVLALLLVSMLAVAFNVQPVNAEGTFYIRADGSIDPPTPLITTVDNVTYTLTGNITSDADGIVVERDNIMIDGVGNTVGKPQNSHGGFGISVSGRSNVTIKNTNIESFGYGIYLSQSSDNIISGNNITNAIIGIWLESSSSYNSISGNNITNNYDGIWFGGSSNNTISGNTFTNDGIYVEDSYENSVENNTVNGRPLVYLEGVSNYTVDDAGQVVLIRCGNITVEGLNLSRTTVGIELWETSNSTISGNDITANNYHEGVWLYSSSSNSISGNNITNNNGGISLDSSSSYNSISENNITANSGDGIGLSFYSSYNSISGNNITNNVYGIVLGYSSHNSISGNNIKANSYFGIYIESFSSYNSIFGNDITANNIGIVLEYSSNYNSIFGNDITANNHYGIRFYSSFSNKIFHNNFVNNKILQTDPYPPYDTIWDNGYPSGGNYWSDYIGIDSNHDGIGDSNYTIDANNNDRYPLMGMFTEFNATSEYHVQTICNSTISDFQFNGTTIRFNVSGENRTVGFCRICIPTALMNGTYRVFVNDTEVFSILLSYSNSTHSYLYFNYTHSAKEVVIVPEFPSFLILPLFMMATLLAAIIYRKKHINRKRYQNPKNPPRHTSL